MLEIFRAIADGFKKYPLPTVCAILLGAVGNLWINNDSLRNRLEAKDAANMIEIRKCIEVQILQERKCNSIIDSILRAELRKTENQIKEMELIMKKAKKR